MNTGKLSDWLQIAASVGVIIGLVMVGYEIRVSNRIGIEQASSMAIERWDRINEFMLTEGVADIFVRANRGEALTAAEALQLKALADSALMAMQYDLQLAETGSWDSYDDIEGIYDRTIQLYVGNEYSRRQWEMAKHAWDPWFVSIVDQALAKSDKRDVISELDYVLGIAEGLPRPVD